MPKKYIPRLITNEVLAASKEYPILTISGPRQSGKTTLVKHLFAELPYFNLESPDILDMISVDTKAFLRQYPQGAVIDEIQRFPELLSYLQVAVDENDKCKFVITGSNQFSMLEKVTQSLAGRTAILKLLPFSIDEISILQPNATADELIYKGTLPSIYTEKREPLRAYRNYYETYIERDVRMLINIKDISLFKKFMKLCAGHVGQIFNASQLANETGVSVNTIKSWMSVLETSFIVYLLPPWYDNIKKRLIKSPKLFFYDVGLASYLLGLRNPMHVQRDPLRGGLFENLVITEIIKKYYNSGIAADIFFYRDKNGNEVDAVLPISRDLIPIEIKSSETFHSGFLKSILYFQKLYPNRIIYPKLVYGGTEEQNTGKIEIINFKNIYRNIEL